MPYIKDSRKKDIKKSSMIDSSEIETAGELNYAITELIKAYYFNGIPNYQAINDVIGALEGAKSEFYRRIAAPYEDEKIKENGDVYPEVPKK